MKINYGPNVDQSKVSDYSKKVLIDIATKAGLDSILVTSFTRTPKELARIMHDNAVIHGAASQLAIYKAPGQAVIQVFINSIHLSAADTINAMEAEIIKQGPTNVSRHCSDPAKLQVFDCANSGLGSKASQFAAIASKDPRVSKILEENNVKHLEVPTLAN